ncbi:rCG29598, partial [Rattus norvegicus]
MAGNLNWAMREC